MGQNPVPSVNIPIPTKIGSKMGGEFTHPPKWDAKTVLTTTAISAGTFDSLRQRLVNLELPELAVREPRDGRASFCLFFFVGPSACHMNCGKLKRHLNIGGLLKKIDGPVNGIKPYFYANQPKKDTHGLDN